MSLVLSRKNLESILIGDDIFVTVTKTGRSKTTLAIDAPPSVSILRAELLKNNVLLKTKDRYLLIYNESIRQFVLDSINPSDSKLDTLRSEGFEFKLVEGSITEIHELFS